MKYHVYRFRLTYPGRELIKSFETQKEAQELVHSVEGSSDTSVKDKDLIKTIGKWFLAWEEEKPAPDSLP